MRDPRRLFTDAQARQIAARQNGRCWNCHELLQTGYHVHHVIEWTAGGTTEVDNGIAVCTSCHHDFHQPKETIPMNRIQLRDWQKRCKDAFYETLCASDQTGKMIFKIEACVAAGKSTMMAELARALILGEWAEEFGFEFIAIVAPNLAITGAHTSKDRESFGIIGALEQRGIWATERITADGRMPFSFMPPEAKQTDAGVTGVAAVFTYHYMRQENVQRQLLDWARAGKKIAMFYDEIHHVPDLGSSWSEGLKRVNAGTDLAAYFSGTWYRTDQRAIIDQTTEGVLEPNFSYTYAEAIVDGIVRPVSFWIPNTLARSTDERGMVIDERPIDQYLEEIPLEVKDAMFDPNGWFVDTMIRRANDELARRRTKYSDAGCLIICPPGFHDDYDESSEALAEQNRTAEEIHRRVEKVTGKKATLVLNGHPPERIAEFRESGAEFIVAVNRISDVISRDCVSCLFFAIYRGQSFSLTKLSAESFAVGQKMMKNPP